MLLNKIDVFDMLKFQNSASQLQLLI